MIRRRRVDAQRRAELRDGLLRRRRRAAELRRWARSKDAVTRALDPSEETPDRPPVVERSGPVEPVRVGAGGRRYQVVRLSDGVFGVRVGRRVVSQHRTAVEANRCIDLMEDNR